MHVSSSLWKDDKNAFYDEKDEYANLSQTGRYYVGGLLAHSRALCAITNPTTNSYRRLVPGYEAPRLRRVEQGQQVGQRQDSAPLQGQVRHEGQEGRVQDARPIREHRTSRSRPSSRQAWTGSRRSSTPETRSTRTSTSSHRRRERSSGSGSFPVASSRRSSPSRATRASSRASSRTTSSR